MQIETPASASIGNELTLKISLQENAAYLAKVQAIKPMLALLFECSEDDINAYITGAGDAEPVDLEVTIRGRAIAECDLQMTFASFKTTEAGRYHSAMEILREWSDKTGMENGGIAHFFNVKVEEITDWSIIERDLENLKFTLKGKVILEFDFQMTFVTFKTTEREWCDNAFAILTDYEDATKLENGGTAQFSNLNIAGIKRHKIIASKKLKAS